MTKLRFFCFSALATVIMPINVNAYPVRPTTPPSAQLFLPAGCYLDCLHLQWRSHHRWGSNGGGDWHNRWRSHFRWGSYGGYFHDRAYSHNRWGSYHRYWRRGESYYGGGYVD